MKLSQAIAGVLTVMPTAAFAHPHHDPATNLSHSHVGEVAIFALIGIVAFVAWRRVVRTNRNRRD